MKKLWLSISLLPALALSAAAAPVSSSCTLFTSFGEAQARFEIQSLMVLSTLTVNGVDIPNMHPTCIIAPRGGLRCVHDDGRRFFTVFPAVDDDTNKVVGMRILVTDKTTGDAVDFEGAECAAP